jgi:sensor domain CHASE-containing protein/signal transduction histidine kinase/HAMP domain-containing protein
MTLQRRVVSTVAVSVGALLVLSALGLILVLRLGLDRSMEQMMVGFGHAEDDAAEKDMRRVQDSYQADLLEIEAKTIDWSRWDDTWKFIKDRNPDYIASNLDNSVLSQMGYNQLLIFSTSGELVAFLSGDRQTGKPLPLPKQMLETLATNERILHLQNPDTVVSGLLDLPDGPVMFAARPVIRTNGEGPIRGTLIFAKNFDRQALERISDLTHLNLDFGPIQDSLDDTKKSFPNWSVVSDDSIIGELLVRDFFGKPSFCLHIRLPRVTHRYALESKANVLAVGTNTAYLLLGLAFLGGIMLVLTLSFFIHRFVVSRILRLQRQADDIRGRFDPSLRIEDLGPDEIGSLANRFNGVLESLHQQHLERKVLLDALPTGVVALNEKFQICGAPSKNTLAWLGPDSVGKDWGLAVGLSPQEIISLNDFLDVLAQELLSNRDMIPLNPYPEMSLPGLVDRWVRLSYFRLPPVAHVSSDDAIILVVLEDVTEERKKAFEIEGMQAETLWLKAVLVDPDLFLEFFQESHRSIQAIEEALLLPFDPSHIARAFRHTHTVQGCASGFGLQNVGLVAISLQVQLTHLLRNANDAESEGVAKSLQALKQLKTTVAKEEARLQKVLRQHSADWREGPSLRVALHRLREWSALLASGAVQDVHRDIEASMRMPLGRILHRTVLWFPGMVARSNKLAEIHLDGGNLLLPVDWSGLLNDILVHLLRNCVAHGIETPEDRLLHHKPEMGSIRIVGRKIGHDLQIDVEDDGMGFDVDVQQAFELGFSSQKEADEFAGYGIGLPAVKAMVEELGGSIQVESQRGRGSRVLLRFSLATGSF